ncbi:MAG: helix-turn-helix transcriptional regulator [Cellulomonadaceae bacterium]|nr:helix-turn-helix transcriptional regulator [Cellulomonadaceae bacterium]
MSSLTDAVYLRMLASPDMAVEDIARDIGVDADSIRASLDELAQASLVEVMRGETPHVRPISPDIAVAALLAREQATIAQRSQQVEAGRIALAQLLATQRKLQQSPEMTVLPTVEEVRDRLGALMLECTEEVATLSPVSKPSPRSIEASRAVDLEALERGLRLRIVHLESIRNDPASWDHLAWQRDQGIEVRLAPVVPVRLILLDASHALVPLQRVERGAGAVLLSSPGVITALRALFDQVWRTARPMGAKHTRDADGLSRQEHALMVLWAKGATDEAASRQLGVSVRTIRRLSANLMERLHAVSRFQAGARAFELGWLTVEDLE